MSITFPAKDFAVPAADLSADSPAKPACPVKRLSILIPVYNEIRTLDKLLTKVLEAPLPCERELVIVDDCSRDGSREFLIRFAEEHPATVRLVLHKKNGGKGQAIRTAIKHMTGDWAIIQDADLEYDPNEIQNLLAPVIEGVADAVFGSRFLQGRYRRAMYFWHTQANHFLTLMSNVLNDLNLTDMETCYKLIRTDILKNLVIRSKGFDLEPELTAKLARWGARLYEVPISYRGRTYAEGKKITAKDAIFALSAMIRYRFFDHHFCQHEGFLILQAVRKAKRFNRWLFSQFSSYLGDDVMEAGCGIGNLTELVLDKKRLVCVDHETFYVDRLRQAYGHLGNFSVMQADLTDELHVRRASGDKPFDSIFCINVAEHIEDDRTVFRNFFNAIRPGGYAIILVPHDPNLYTAVDKALGHFRRYTRKELKTKLEAEGFKVEKCFGFNRVGGFGWWLSGKVLGKKTLSSGQMTIFEFLMPLIRALENIPFFSHNSLIAIARKP